MPGTSSGPSRAKRRPAGVRPGPALPAAVRTLRAALVGGTPSTRVRAARTIVELALRVGDQDLEARLTAVEERLKGAAARNDVSTYS